MKKPNQLKYKYNEIKMTGFSAVTYMLTEYHDQGR